MNEYIATQSSDRSVKLYSISAKGGTLETHPVGSNSKMVLKGSRRHQRTGSTTSMKGGVNNHSRATSVTRPSPAPAGMGGDNGKGRRSHVRRSSISSEASSVSMAPSARGDFRESISMGGGAMDAPLTPATSTTSGVGGMFLPPSSSSYPSTGIKESSNSSTAQTHLGREKENPTPFKEYREPRTAATSRRSSFSGSQAPGSPASFRGRVMADERWVILHLYQDVFREFILTLSWTAGTHALRMDVLPPQCHLFRPFARPIHQQAPRQQRGLRRPSLLPSIPPIPPAG
jgi:hypothetical protein